MQVYEFSNLSDLAKFFLAKGSECRDEAEFYRSKDKNKAEARCLVRAAIWEEAAEIANKTVLLYVNDLVDKLEKATGAVDIHTQRPRPVSDSK